MPGPAGSAFTAKGVLTLVAAPEVMVMLYVLGVVALPATSPEGTTALICVWLA